MQANMKTLTAMQLMQEPGILSFIEGSKNTPILDLFVAVKTAYPNLQGTFVDLRAAYNATKRQAQPPVVDKEPAKVEAAPKAKAPKRRPKTATPPATLSFDKKAEGLFTKMAPVFDAPFTEWTQKDIEKIHPCLTLLHGKITAAQAYREATKTDVSAQVPVVQVKTTTDLAQQLRELLTATHTSAQQKVAMALLSGRGSPVSSVALAKDTGLSRATISRAVYNLRQDPAFRKLARIDSEMGRDSAGYSLKLAS